MTIEQAECRGGLVIGSLREDGYTTEQIKALLVAALNQVHSICDKCGAEIPLGILSPLTRHSRK
jgi:hypothetical protein